MSKNQLLPIVLNLIAALLGAFGQYAYKKGGLKIGTTALLKNYELWVGMLLFCIVMALFILGYKVGGRISIVYPFYATTFIWAMLIGYYFDKEPINLFLVSGTLLITVGLGIIAFGMGRS